MYRQYICHILLSHRMLQDSSLHFMTVLNTSLISHVLIKLKTDMNTEHKGDLVHFEFYGTFFSLLDIYIIHELSFVTSKVLPKSK